MRTARRVILMGLLGSVACGEPDASMTRSPSAPESNGAPPGCAEVKTTSSGLRRLSKAEYEETLRSLFGDAAIDGVAAAIKSVPEDRLKDRVFSSMTTTTTGEHVEGYSIVADRLSSFLTETADRVRSLDACLTDAEPSPACVDGFLARLGRRAYRRPLADDEMQELRSTYADGRAISAQDGLKFVLYRLLQAPAFLYRIELGTDAAPCSTDGKTYTLSAYELATRLSYVAIGQPPDDALLDAARDGALDTEEGLKAQVERLFADPRALVHIEGFFTEWLGTDFLPALGQSDAFLAGAPRDTLLGDVREELRRYVEYHVVSGSRYSDLLTSTVTFPSDAVAKLYAVTPGPDGRATLQGERVGLLGRIALLVGGSEATHPIKRGALVRRMLLCESVESPDPSTVPPDAFEPPPFSPTKSGRQRWTEKTSATQCAACHARINPIGFALEGFDALGRYRQTEPIVDPATSTTVNQLPIDTGVDLAFDGDAPAHVAGERALAELLAKSARANRCFSQQWFRFVFGRLDDVDDESVVTALARANSEEGGSLLASLKKIALTPEFRVRRMP